MSVARTGRSSTPRTNRFSVRMGYAGQKKVVGPRNDTFARLQSGIDKSPSIKPPIRSASNTRLSVSSAKRHVTHNGSVAATGNHTTPHRKPRFSDHMFHDNPKNCIRIVPSRNTVRKNIMDPQNMTYHHAYTIEVDGLTRQCESAAMILREKQRTGHLAFERDFGNQSDPRNYKESVPRKRLQVNIPRNVQSSIQIEENCVVADRERNNTQSSSSQPRKRFLRSQTTQMEADTYFDHDLTPRHSSGGVASVHFGKRRLETAQNLDDHVDFSFEPAQGFIKEDLVAASAERMISAPRCTRKMSPHRNRSDGVSFVTHTGIGFRSPSAANSLTLTTDMDLHHFAKKRMASPRAFHTNWRWNEQKHGTQTPEPSPARTIPTRHEPHDRIRMCCDPIEKEKVHIPSETLVWRAEQSILPNSDPTRTREFSSIPRKHRSATQERSVSRSDNVENVRHHKRLNYNARRSRGNFLAWEW